MADARDIAAELTRAEVQARLFGTAPESVMFSRFRVLQLIGAGAMGSVYAAHDPQLDRKIALKLIRLGRGNDTEKGRARLLREARALAQLAPPNVVAVYDAGEIAGQVFLAMALVDGTTLRQWQEQQPRSWRELAKMYLQVARGLAEVERSGLVHRDFKPSNVVVGDDGQARIIDFGLARTGDDADEPAVLGFPDEELSSTLTRTGALLGTPFYMAPEQHRGDAADARSDQYSFCVALYEALYGEHPCTWTSRIELVEAVTAGTFADEPASSKVPAALRRLVLRGLDPNPAKRLPSMDALVEELSALVDGARRRKLRAGVFAAVAVAAGVAIGVTATRSGANNDVATRQKRCLVRADALAAVWTDAQRGKARGAFDSADRRLGRDTFNRVERAVDAHLRVGKRVYTAACKSADDAGQSTQLFDRRMLCIKRSVGRVESLIEQLSGGERAVVLKAVDAVDKLPSFEHCANVDRLAGRPALPSDTTKLTAAMVQLAKAQVLAYTGKYREALLGARLVLADPAATYPVLRAEAHLLAGWLLQMTQKFAAARTSLEAAGKAAAAAKDDRLVALATMRLMGALTLAQKLDEAKAMLAAAETAVIRVGEERAVKAEFEGQVATLLANRGDLEAAKRRNAEAIRLYRQLNDRFNLAATMESRAFLLMRVHELTKAESLLRKVLGMREARLGRMHPRVADVLTVLGKVQQGNGNLDAAGDTLRRADSIYGGASTPPEILNNLGDIELVKKRYKSALELFRRAERAIARKHGSSFPAVAYSVDKQAKVELERGRVDAARALVKRALAIWDKAFPGNHPDKAIGWSTLATIEMRTNNHKAARDLLLRVIDAWTKALGANNGLLAQQHADLGECYLALGQRGKAVEALQRALALGGKLKPPYFFRAKTDQLLARARKP